MDNRGPPRTSKKPSGSPDKKSGKKSGHGVKKKKKSRKRCERPEPEHGKTSSRPTSPDGEPMSGLDSDVSGQREPAASTDQVQIEVAGCGMSTGNKTSVPATFSGKPRAAANQVNGSKSTSQGFEVKLKSSNGVTVPTVRMRKSGSTEQARNSFSSMSISTRNSSQSLRWECSLSDPEQEEERIHAYKINRRKRYLAAANKNYAEWMTSCSSNMSVTSASGAGNRDVIMMKHSHPGSEMSSSLPSFCAQSGSSLLVHHHDRQIPALHSPHISHSATQEIYLNC